MFFMKAILPFAIAIPLATTTIEQQLISSDELLVAQPLPLEGWMSDFSMAQKAAVEQNKPILIAFLGPNWCPWSDQLEREVLVDSAFVQEMKDKVILLKVDIPEDFAIHSDESLPSLKLKDRYHIEECPALVLVEPMGGEIAQLKYLPLQSNEFAGYINGMLNDYAKVNEAVERKNLENLSEKELKTLYAKAGRFADSTFKRTLLKKGLKEDKSPYFLIEEYGYLVARGHFKDRKLSRIRNKILARDPKNEKGALRQLAILDFEALAKGGRRHQSTQKTIEPLVKYLKAFGKSDAENGWKMEMMISEYLFAKDQTEGALKHAQASLEIAPDFAKKEIAQSIEYLQTKLEPNR